MAHLQYMPGDPRLVDQLVYELKSKGIFDQFRKDCIADVDTRPAYQNLRQRVENSVSTFLSRQTWQPDLNKNQLREKLRKHILDGNYLEQGVERIVDQVVNPKVATVFIPKVEDLVYNYLGIARKKSVTTETSNGKVDDLLPTDLEAVSPGSVKSNDDKNDAMEVDNVQEENKMDIDEEKSKNEIKEDTIEDNKEENPEDIKLANSNSNSDDKSNIPLPFEEIKPENIPSPDNSPRKVELEKIELPKTPIVSTDIPLPEDTNKDDKDKFFKPINSDDDDSSSDSSLRRNMSPLTPIRNFNNENSCDAQQGFENDVEPKGDVEKEPSSFKFAIDAKSENNTEVVKEDKKEIDTSLSYQFNNQVNINHFNTPLYEDSSNSNNLQIDYESDANSKIVADSKVTESESNQNSEELKKERKPEEKKSSHKSSHRSRDSHKHSSSRDKRSDSKQSSSRDSKNEKSKSSKDESKSKSSDKDRSRDRSDKKDSRDSSRHRSSHKSSHKDSKSHRSSSSGHKHSSKHSDEKKPTSSSSQKNKDKSDKSMDKPKDPKSTSHRSDKDRKSSSSSSRSDKNSKHKHDDKDKNKKTKKETDDHYSLSGRNNPNRRSTDRDSNDGSSSSKGSNLPSNKSSMSKKESKSSSKSESTSTSGDSTSPSDKENVVQDHGTKANDTQNKPIRIESHLEQPIVSPPRLPFVPDITIKKPKFAANLEEAKRLMKMRKFLDEEQKRMNQEAVLLLEFQANVRPSLSQVYSNISGPELEFACITNTGQDQELMIHNNDNISNREYVQETHYTNNQLLNVLNDATIEVEKNHLQMIQDEPDKISNINGIDNENEIINVYENHIIEANIDNDKETKNIPKNDDDVENSEKSIGVDTEFEITIIAEELSENEESLNDCVKSKINLATTQNMSTKTESHINGEVKLCYFAEHEKYNAEIETAKFNNFLKEYTKTPSKLYLINCDSYEENVIRNESKKFGNFEIVSYQKNGHLKLPKVNNVIKNVNISTEISLPIDNDYDESLKSSFFSPDKSECSFELSDYDAKLEEMVNKTSRQEIMEIILGNANASPSKMPRIDYFTESKIDNNIDSNLKRKLNDESINNNIHVLAPNKIRRLSTEQITSTTQESEEIPNKVNNTRSKYLGRAKRVGLPRPKRTVLPNSPSSDKSVENYEQNTKQTPNGKIKRNKIQRYDTSDLYKPKLHFLSRRNPVT